MSTKYYHIYFYIYTTINNLTLAMRTNLINGPSLVLT